MHLYTRPFILSCMLLGLVNNNCRQTPIESFNDPLVPHITNPVKFYLQEQIDFKSITKIYNSKGDPSFVCNPQRDDSGEVIKLEKVADPNQYKLIKLADLTCSKDAKWPTYYLDTTTGKWEIEDSKHQPGTLSSVYRTTEKTGGIPGEITATGAFDNIEATISPAQPGPSSLPAGKYFAIDIPGNPGHSPYVEWLDAVQLVIILIHYSRTCQHSS